MCKHLAHFTVLSGY